MCGNAKKYAVKARKFLITAQKILAKFNVFCLRRSLLERGFDVLSSCKLSLEACLTPRGSVLICKTVITSRCSNSESRFASSFRAFGEYFLTSLTITSNMCSNTSSSGAITSNFAGTSLLRRDRVVIYHGHNRTERDSAGSSNSHVHFGEIDPALRRSVLLS